MSIKINGNFGVQEAPPADTVITTNVSCKANSNNTLERMPESDYYDKQRKKKTIGIIAGLILTAAAVVGGICWHKGKPANGESKEFLERMKDGWKELIGKGKKAAEDGSGKVGEAADGAKSETEKAGETAARETKLETEKATGTAVKETAESTKPEAAAANAEVKEEITKELEKKLNYEIMVDDNKIIVKNGEIDYCINRHNQKWNIDDKTDPKYAQKIRNAVDTKSKAMIEQEKKALKKPEQEPKPQTNIEKSENDEVVNNKKPARKKSKKVKK